jgi:hypothetical protein
MMSSYFSRETAYQLLFFVIIYYLFLRYTGFYPQTSNMYTTIIVDTILVGLFLYFQKVMVEYFVVNEYFRKTIKIKQNF